MSDPYIPPRDTDYDSWLNNFKTLILAAPTTYGLTITDASAINTYYNSWHAAYLLAINPTTRTPVTVAAKDTQKALTQPPIRVYAQTIRANAGVSDANKIALGLNLPNFTPTPIPQPSTSPLINVIGATPLQHTLRYADTNTPDSKKKPFGAQQLLLFVAVADDPVVDPTVALFYGAFTKVPVFVDFDAADVGKAATYFARWQTRTGLLGPWSLPVSMTVAN